MIRGNASVIFWLEKDDSRGNASRWIQYRFDAKFSSNVHTESASKRTRVTLSTASGLRRPVRTLIPPLAVACREKCKSDTHSPTVRWLTDLLGSWFGQNCCEIPWLFCLPFLSQAVWPSTSHVTRRLYRSRNSESGHNHTELPKPVVKTTPHLRLSPIFL